MLSLTIHDDPYTGGGVCESHGRVVTLQKTLSLQGQYSSTEHPGFPEA